MSEITPGKMVEKTPLETKDDASKTEASFKTPAKPSTEIKTSKVNDTRPELQAKPFPSPEPSSDPAAFWPEDRPSNVEAPPRDQVYPPTDRQANQNQVAVPETYRTPDGYLVTKHPAANAMVNKREAVENVHRSMGVKPRQHVDDAAVPTGDLDGQMDAKRAEIRDMEAAISRKRGELDGILRHKNRPVG